MTFYESINKYYDNIFPLNMNQVSFVSSYFNDKKSKLIEIGCANGKLTNALKYYDIMGIDLEQSFIDIAKDRYKGIQFDQCNMLALSKLNEKFDGIITFGNTLVHLSLTDIIRFIKEAYNNLNYNGKLLIQILNYDYILDNKIDYLPLVDNDVITFIRNYDHNNPFLFNTTLRIKSANSEVKNSIALTPIRKDDLCSILEKTGFKNINVYSSFKKDDYKYNALPLILSCEKLN